MSMILNEDRTKLSILIPNSEATISAQIKNIKDSEVTGYYTNDKEVIKNNIVAFLNKNFEYILDVQSTLKLIDDLKTFKDEYAEIYKDGFSNIDISYDYFKNLNNNFVRIPKMYYSGVDNRYFKFENSDPVVKKLRAILYGDITGFNVDTYNNQYYVITPYLRENAKQILDSKKNKLLNINEIDALRKFYIDNLKDNNDMLKEIENRKRFVLEYPVDKILTMTMDDYCLGLENFKNTFCYKLEFGEYKYTGFGCGGSTSSKFGIYFSETDHKFHGKNNKVIENPNDYFNNYKEQLYNFLKYFENNEPNFIIDEKYSLLGGSGSYMILTKLLSLYYPDKFISMSKREVYKKLGDYLGIKLEKDAIYNSFYGNIAFRKLVPEANDNDGFYVANTIWKFFVGEEKQIEEIETNIEGDETIMQEKFKQWLLENGLMETTVNGYINAINLTSREAMEDGIITKELFNIENVLELDKIIDVLSTNEKFLKRKENTHNHNSAPLNRYRDFLSMISTKPEAIEEYDKNKFLEEVFITEDKYDSIVSILSKKKNIILEGAPGVGKTFIAKRLAYSIIGAKDKSKVELIQFHQSYSYEEFIEGYRPVENGFELQRGIFYKLCKKAENDKANNYYLVIDEINRGNLSKIFGELLMLIEADKRGDSLKLAYSEEEFSVPENLYIIGLMNTADRSLALIDYALRRRFSFIKIEPAFESEKFRKAFNNKFDKDYENVINIIIKINEAIKNDKSLGDGFKIGHSYFCPDIKDRKGNKKDIQDIINYEIIPLLEEYWYDDEDSLVQWENALNGVINDD